MVDQKSGVRVMPVIGIVLIVLLVLSAVSIYSAAQHRGRADAARADAALLAGLVSALPADGQAAMSGDSDAFARLSTSAQQARVLASGLNALAKVSGLGDLLDSADSLAVSSEPVMRAHTAAGEVDAASGGIGRTVVALSDVAPAGSRGVLQDTARTARRVAIGTRSLLADSVAREETTRLLGDDELRLGQLVTGLTGQDNALGLEPLRIAGRESQIAEFADFYERINGAVLTSIANAADYASVQDAANAMAGSSAQVAKRLANLNVATPPPGIGPLQINSPWFVVAMLVIAALLAIVATWLSFSGEDTRRAAERQNTQNERNQAAILRLLDELGSLADGDLTVQATVTEDITGAIADSINYAIEALRELVATIEDSAIKIDGAARQTRATGGHLAQASETQSKQVGDASESIARMAASIEAVSGDSERSADVARHSVDVAHKGGDAVRRTIEGMNTIRETIQDTSKRIKRLGESSQEIGNIVELINDIAEQTNILALNASIQASMAGEAGRGFAVVADEVQRLAERSANATRQIEVLVNTIQSDTNEAVVSMERSTTDVVGGALLAENAGAALDEIESVSNQIASLVQNISSTAGEQAVAAADVTRNMGVLREVSSQTAEATSATSDSIGKLADLASQLRNSVAGFRLPESSKASGARSATGASGEKADLTSVKATG
ncbi:MAG: methyl-accepting chemotaxis protein [Gammaproteobacteria bacterium]